MRRYLAGALGLVTLLAACNGDDKNPVAPPVVVPSGPSFAAGGSVGVNLDQWANGKTPPTGESWQNGNLNGNNSAYGEDKVVPFRLAVENLGAPPTSAGHFITIEHDFTAGGSKAYDFLASANVTETTIFNKVCATGGGGVSSLCNGSTGAMPGGVPFADVDLPPDPFVAATGKTVDGAIAASGMGAQRKFRIYGITQAAADAGDVLITGVSHDGVLTGGTIPGNSVTQFLVTFKTSSTAVLMVWGGHLATSGYWDPPTAKGASTISGAPWHMRTMNLDGGGASNQDRSIQPSALVKPVLAITKVANPSGPVDAPASIGFDIKVTNNGPGTAFNVVINDALPGKSGVDWTTSSTGCVVNGSPPNETLHCDITSLVQGASFTATVTSATTPASCGLITNPGATASATNSEPVTSGPASVTVNCADVSISKSADAASVSAGDQIGFTVTVKNGGSGAASNVQVNDPLPAGSGISWSIDAANSDAGWSISAPPQVLSYGPTGLAAGASVKVHVISSTTKASCGKYDNTATLTGTDKTASASETVQCPDVSLSKTADAATVDAGQQIGFTIEVKNSSAAGTGTAKNVTVSDNLPAGPGITWSIDGPANGFSITGPPPNQVLHYGPADLAAGASSAVHIISSTTAASCGKYDNTASATVSNGNNPKDATASTTVQCATIKIEKSADAASVAAGSPIGFTITVTNTGAVNATGVSVTDNLPGGTGISWSVDAANSDAGWAITGSSPQVLGYGPAGLAAGASVKVHVVSNTGEASCQKYDNTASATLSNGTKPQDASASTTVVCATVTLEKKADAASVTAGSQIGFTVTVKNTGTVNATDVSVTDNLPAGAGVTWSVDAAGSDAGWTINGTSPQVLSYGPAGLAAGASVKVHVISSTTEESCKEYNNTAKATVGNGADPGDASASTTVVCSTVTLDKKADAASVSAGSQIGFTVTVKNTGAVNATGVSVTDNLPGGTGVSWSIDAAGSDAGWAIAGASPQVLSYGPAALAAGASVKVHVISATTEESCKEYNNTAKATVANGADPDDASASTSVKCPNVSLKKTADAASVVAGSQIGFVVELSNGGTGAATGVTVTDNLPSGAGIDWSIDAANSGAGWSISGSPPNEVLSFGPGTLAAGATNKVHLISGTTAASCKKYDNTASATVGNGTDPGNASASTTVKCLPTLIVTKTIVGGGSQLFDFTQTTTTNTSYNLTHQGSKTTSNIQPNTYTVCEVNLAVSWKATATIDGTPALLTNPNANDVPAQDLGTRCVSVKLDYDETRTVAWTNTPPPGGDARTIGYWKNWSSCTGGGQYTKARDRGLLGKTLDGNLPQTVGNLALAGGTPSPDCQKAVYILDKSDIATGKKAASDAAYNLAAQFLAALLNKNAKAAVCPAAQTNMDLAQALLVKINFTGTGSYLKKFDAATTAQANALATKLDQYNNNNPAGCQ